MIRLACIIRGVLLPFILLVFTGVMCVIALGVVLFVRNRQFEEAVLRFWAKTICWLVGIRIKVIGTENIPSGGVLFVFNHQSLLDIPVAHSAIPKDFRFGAKIELYRIPIFGATMRAMRAIPIARGNRAEAIQALKEAAERMDHGESFMLAPEGTRQKEPVIAPFKSGPFVMAIGAQKPIVPVVIKGIHKIMPKKALLIHTGAWVSEIEVKVLKPFDVAGFKFEDRDTLKNQVREVMEAAYYND